MSCILVVGFFGRNFFAIHSAQNIRCDAYKERIFMHSDAVIKMEKLFASKSLQMCLLPVVVFCFSADCAAAAFVVTCSVKRTDFLVRKKIKTIDVNVLSLGMRTKKTNEDRKQQRRHISNCLFVFLSHFFWR